MTRPDGTALLIGATGMVGHALYLEALVRGIPVAGTCLGADYGFPFHQLPLEDTAALTALVRELRPRTVILAAAQTHVDRCELEPEAARRVNVDPCRTLAALAGELGFTTVFFSSDYVFDGAAGPYAEDAAPNPICEYGRQKAEAEDVLASAGLSHLTVRTTGVYGPELAGINFVLRLVAAVRAGETWRVPADQYGSPTYAPALAAAVWDLLERPARGLFHVAGSDFLDRHSFALEIARCFALDAGRILPASTPELRQAAPRPLRAGLSCQRAERLLGRSMTGIAEGLARTREWRDRALAAGG